MLMLHQMLPHEHHKHGDVAVHLEEDNHHHHDGQGHHPQDQNEDDDEDGLLGLLLGSHAHSVQLSDVQFFRNTQKQGNEVAKSTSLAVEFKPITFLVCKANVTTPFPPESEYLPSRHFLVSNALRGPPTLG